MPSSLDTPVTGGTPNPLGSLVAAAQPLPEDAEWEAFGVEHDPEACLGAWVWQKCSVDGDEGVDEEPVHKPLNDGVDALRFLPFLAEANAASCDGLPGDLDVLEARARRVLSWNYSQQIARAFSSSAPDGFPNVNPNLTNGQDVTPGAGPSSLCNTIAGLLEEAVECGLNGDLWIHAPAWTLPAFLEHHQIVQVGNVWKLGPHTVILDQGFANEGPPGGDVPADGQAWIYVTSPVQVSTGPVHILRDGRAPLPASLHGLEPRLNRANVIAAQLAIYRFDACCIKGALAAVC